MSAVFITGTGTGVGKTFVTCGLIRTLRARHRKVEALKPIVSGFDPAAPSDSDSALLLSALGRPVTAETIGAISPWRFMAPLAPDMAAARENRALDFPALVAFCHAAIAANDNALLIEGVGGLMSPVNVDHVVLDWMVALGIPVILVAGSYLGTISHTLTALDVMARHGLAISHVVISESAGSAVPLDETRDAVARFAPRVDVLALPRQSGEKGHPAFENLATRMRL